MIRRQLTVAGDLDLETFYSKVNLFFFFIFFFFFFSGGGGGGGGGGVCCIHPQSQWGSGAGALQLVCPKLSAVLIARYTGVE